MSQPLNKSDVILVTGGHGFLGKHVVNELRSKGFTSVVSPMHSEYDLEYQSDTYDLLRTFQPKAVIHLAGRVGGIGANQVNPGAYFYSNMQMGMNILECAHSTKVDRVVIIGTVCSYPKHTPVPFAEEHLWFGYPEETNAPYGIAKRALYTMAQAYNEQYGMNNLVLLPTNLYGPGDDFDDRTSHVIPAIIKKVYRTLKNGGLVELWGTGEASREFLYVKDCAEGIVRALTQCDYHGPINLGTGREITIKRLADMIAGLMNYNGQILFDSKHPDGQPRRCLKTDKAERFFGWKARTTLSQGLLETILWYEEQERERISNNCVQ